MNAVTTAPPEADDTYESFTTTLPPEKVKMETKNLDFYYGKNKTLHGVNLQVLDKGVTAMIGPSGCGKSTLLRVLNRIYALYPGQRAEGEVTLDGQNNLSRVDMNLRVEEALRAAALWDEVKDKLNTSGLGLSGGQQQRLCVARGIAVKPEVLLLDEPASALDPRSTAMLEQTIVQLKKDYTIVIVTHNMGQATRVSDNTAFMYLGRLIEFGPTQELFQSPKAQRTKAYVTGQFG